MMAVNIEVVDGFFDALECPICNGFFSGPIFQCVQGHSICSTCKNKVLNCPSCRKQFTEARNYSLEHMSQHVKLPCMNREFGCTMMLLVADRESHIKVCPYRPYECLPGKETGCKWKGGRCNILSHVRSKHNISLTNMRGNNSLLKLLEERFINFDEDSKSIEIISAFGDIFWFHYAMKSSDKTLYASVHYIGPQEICTKYFYKISYFIPFCVSTPNHMVTFCTHVHPDHVGIEELIKIKKCSSLSKEMSSYFISNNALRYELSIMKAN